MGVPQGPIRVPLQKSCHQSCFLGDISMLLSLIKNLLTEKEEAYTLHLPLNLSVDFNVHLRVFLVRKVVVINGEKLG